MPLSTDLMLPETTGDTCVSVPTLAGVGEDTGSRKIGPYEPKNQVCVLKIVFLNTF